MTFSKEINCTSLSFKVIVLTVHFHFLEVRSVLPIHTGRTRSCSLSLPSCPRCIIFMPNIVLCGGTLLVLQ